MKLKKSFWVSSLIFTFLIISCASNSVPVPGEGSVRKANIYTEYYNLAESYFKIPDYTNAIKYYQMAMNNKKNYWASYYKLAKCYVYTQDWNNAEKMYNALLKRDPDNDSLKASLAYIYLMKSDSKKALLKYNELLEKQPNNKEYLENYLTLVLSDKYLFNNYEKDFYARFETLKESYPDNEKNLKFQEILDKIVEPAAEN